MKILNITTGLLLAAAAMPSPQASAVDASRSYWDQGGAACQLSVPTTDTQVRPRATGMRNEGATSAFIICQIAGTSDWFTSASIKLVSIDGASHSVSCTGSNGNTASNIYYSTKVTATGTGTGGADVTWTPADLSATTSFNNAMFSVTCNLPPGAAVMYVHATYTEYVGA